MICPGADHLFYGMRIKEKKCSIYIIIRIKTIYIDVLYFFLISIVQHSSFTYRERREGGGTREKWIKTKKIKEIAYIYTLISSSFLNN